MEMPRGQLAEQAEYCADILAQTLRDAGFPFIALNPGASYRGLHDSLVNFLGNKDPKMLLCLHEAHAVGLAHGYSKVAEAPMAVALHSNVGLMNGSMAIYNAWCDRAPVVILGATGPVDSVERRPWIDWIHTAADQGALIRNFTKWDDQPASAAAAHESLLRADWIARSHPQGPTYVNLDAGMQEARIETPLPKLSGSRYQAAADFSVGRREAKRVAELIRDASKPVVMMGRVSRDEGDWQRRVAWVEAMGAVVVTDLRTAAAFPSDHPQHVGPAAIFASSQVGDVLKDADLIISLDWLDLAGTFKRALRGVLPSAHVVHVSVDHTIHNGWSKDHQAFPPVDTMIFSQPDRFVEEMSAFGLPRRVPFKINEMTRVEKNRNPAPPEKQMEICHVANSLRRATKGFEVTLIQPTISWHGDFWPISHPLDYLGNDGGGGVGSGPALAVGAALALQDTGRLPVAVLGDGNFIMGVTALWTAVHYKIPLLVVVANNTSFLNDEVHQQRIAEERGRPVENKWIGMRMTDPELDVVKMAQAQGAEGFGPAATVQELDNALALAVAAVNSGKVAVVDARIGQDYSPQ